MIPTEPISMFLNTTGTIITIIASYRNAIGQHDRAIHLWRYSNWFLLLLFFGIAMGWWILNSGAWLQVGVYLTFCILNEYAIWRKSKEDYHV